MKEEPSNKKYIAGFNSAYTIMAENPILLDFLHGITSTDDHILGMRDGRMQFFKEIKMELKKSIEIKEIKLEELRKSKDF